MAWRAPVHGGYYPIDRLSPVEPIKPETFVYKASFTTRFLDLETERCGLPLQN